MISNITSPKWSLGDASAARLIVNAGVNNFGNYQEDWILPGLELHVEFQGTTASGRLFGAVSGKKLGGYIGISYLPPSGGQPGDYHIGTPAGVKSEKFVAAMKAAMKAEKKAEPLSAEEIARVFKTRDEFFSRLAWLEKCTAEMAGGGAK